MTDEVFQVLYCRHSGGYLRVERKYGVDHEGLGSPSWESLWYDIDSGHGTDDGVIRLSVPGVGCSEVLTLVE